MHLLLDSSYFPSSWGGVIYCENGERVAGVRYAESAGKGVLTLSAGENAFEVHAATESFSGSSTNKGGRMLCGMYNCKVSTPLSSIFSRNCPAVSSFVINGNGKCDINPARFRRRWLGEFLATGHPITSLLIIAIWLPYATHPQRDEMGFLLMACIFTALGLGWMLICRWANRNPEPMEW